MHHQHAGISAQLKLCLKVGRQKLQTKKKNTSHRQRATGEWGLYLSNTSAAVIYFAGADKMQTCSLIALACLKKEEEKNHVDPATRSSLCCEPAGSPWWNTHVPNCQNSYSFSAVCLATLIWSEAGVPEVFLWPEKKKQLRNQKWDGDVWESRNGKWHSAAGHTCAIQCK